MINPRNKPKEAIFSLKPTMTDPPDNGAGPSRGIPRTALAEAQALAAAVLPSDMRGKLVASVLIDLVGSASYLVPFAGEGFDLAWAPISMVLVGAMYDGVMPNLKYLALVEELLPFTDVIPTATLGWMREFVPGIIEARIGERRSKRKRN